MDRYLKHLAIFACTIGGTAIGSPHCLDNSYHLTRRNDDKSYHAVACNCPCEKQYKILADRGQCPKCKHFRDPQNTDFFIEKLSASTQRQQCACTHTPSLSLPTPWNHYKHN